MKNYLKDIFIHLDGVIMAPIYELISHNQNFNDNNTISQNSDLYGAYFNVLFKILIAQKLIERKNKNSENFIWSEQAKIILKEKEKFKGIREYYLSSINLLEGHKNISNIDWKTPIDNFNSINEIYGSCSIISKHLEGSIIAPILIFLSKKSNYKNFNDDISLRLDKSLFDFMKKINFLNKGKISEKGKYLMSKSYAYGVTSSYMRTLVQIENLCFNEKSKGSLSIRHISSKIKIKPKNTENHVDRPLNVWGSGKSHKTYFKFIDEYIKNIFNLPIKDQPQGIADMGCGDGSFLLHLYELVKYRTKRGKMLDNYPITLIGADYNQAAIEQTKATFNDSDNQPVTIIGDISRPNKFASDLKKNHDINISNFLNVRSFLDHNRRYRQFKKENDLSFINETSNSFVWRGKSLSKYEVQKNLVNHFKSWKKYISKYGLLVLELHTISLNDVHKNFGKIPMTAYIGTHGFSDQFIVEYEIYKECINMAGLNTTDKFEKFFPNEDIKMISINLIS